MSMIRDYWGGDGSVFQLDWLPQEVACRAIIGLLNAFAFAIFGKSPWAEDVLKKMQDAVSKKIKIDEGL